MSACTRKAHIGLVALLSPISNVLGASVYCQRISHSWYGGIYLSWMVPWYEMQ